LPEQNESEQSRTAPDQKWALYNEKMVELFRERDKHPLDSSAREAAAQAILALWVSEGE
jgi:hypothetical protein